MSSVETVLSAALQLSREEQAEFRAKFDEAAPAPKPWPAYLHPAWKEELARRAAGSRENDVSWEQVEKEMDAAMDAVDREKEARGEV